VAVSQGQIDQALELLDGLGPLRPKRMFGAVGLYCDELFFAVLDEETLYFKVDGESEALFREAGSGPFTFEKDGETVAMGYWRIPETAMDDPEEAVRWARLGVDAALRARAKKPKPKPKTAKPTSLKKSST
jgi:DNA transformation protein